MRSDSFKFEERKEVISSDSTESGELCPTTVYGNQEGYLLVASSCGTGVSILSYQLPNVKSELYEHFIDAQMRQPQVCLYDDNVVVHGLSLSSSDRLLFSTGLMSNF